MALLAVMVVLVSVATGCGSRKSDAAGDRMRAEVAQVRAAAHDALSGSSVSGCDVFIAQGLVGAISFGRGVTAAGRCGRLAIRHGAKAGGDVSVGAVSVTGGAAIAQVQFDGRAAGFRSMTLGLRRVRRRWTVDRLRAGAIDRADFERAIRRAYGRRARQPAVARCVTGEFSTRSDRGLLRATIRHELDLFGVRATVCKVRVLARSVVSARLADCIAGGTRHALTHGRLGRRVAAHGGVSPATYALVLNGRVGHELADACFRKVG